MNDETEEMRVAPPHAFFDLLGIIRGYQRSRAVTAMARLSIADRLGSDRRSVSDLSVAVAADEDALYRLLRALASIGVLDEDGNRAFALTEMGQHPVGSSVHGPSGCVGLRRRPPVGPLAGTPDGGADR